MMRFIIIFLSIFIITIQNVGSTFIQVSINNSIINKEKEKKTIKNKNISKSEIVSDTILKSCSMFSYVDSTLDEIKDSSAWGDLKILVLFLAMKTYFFANDMNSEESIINEDQIDGFFDSLELYIRGDIKKLGNEKKELKELKFDEIKIMLKEMKGDLQNRKKFKERVKLVKNNYLNLDNFLKTYGSDVAFYGAQKFNEGGNAFMSTVLYLLGQAISPDLQSVYTSIVLVKKGFTSNPIITTARYSCKFADAFDTSVKKDEKTIKDLTEKLGDAMKSYFVVTDMMIDLKDFHQCNMISETEINNKLKTYQQVSCQLNDGYNRLLSEVSHESKKSITWQLGSFYNDIVKKTTTKDYLYNMAGMTSCPSDSDIAKQKKIYADIPKISYREEKQTNHSDYCYRMMQKHIKLSQENGRMGHILSYDLLLKQKVLNAISQYEKYINEKSKKTNNSTNNLKKSQSQPTIVQQPTIPQYRTKESHPEYVDAFSSICNGNKAGCGFHSIARNLYKDSFKEYEQYPIDLIKKYVNYPIEAQHYEIREGKLIPTSSFLKDYYTTTTLIHQTARSCEYNLLSGLINQGGNVNALDGRGMTPLYRAVDSFFNESSSVLPKRLSSRACNETIKLLLDNGAKNIKKPTINLGYSSVKDSGTIFDYIIRNDKYPSSSAIKAIMKKWNITDIKKHMNSESIKRIDQYIKTIGEKTISYKNMLQSNETALIKAETQEEKERIQNNITSLKMSVNNFEDLKIFWAGIKK